MLCWCHAPVPLRCGVFGVVICGRGLVICYGGLGALGRPGIRRLKASAGNLGDGGFLGKKHVPCDTLDWVSGLAGCPCYFRGSDG